VLACARWFFRRGGFEYHASCGQSGQSHSAIITVCAMLTRLTEALDGTKTVAD